VRARARARVNIHKINKTINVTKRRTNYNCNNASTYSNMLQLSQYPIEKNKDYQTRA